MTHDRKVNGEMGEVKLMHYLEEIFVMTTTRRFDTLHETYRALLSLLFSELRFVYLARVVNRVSGQCVTVTFAFVPDIIKSKFICKMKLIKDKVILLEKSDICD